MGGDDFAIKCAPGATAIQPSVKPTLADGRIISPGKFCQATVGKAVGLGQSQEVLGHGFLAQVVLKV